MKKLILLGLILSLNGCYQIGFVGGFLTNNIIGDNSQSKGYLNKGLILQDSDIKVHLSSKKEDKKHLAIK